MRFRHLYLLFAAVNMYWLHTRHNFDYAIIMMFSMVLFNIDELRERLDSTQTESTECCNKEES